MEDLGLQGTSNTSFSYLNSERNKEGKSLKKSFLKHVMKPPYPPANLQSAEGQPHLSTQPFPSAKQCVCVEAKGTRRKNVAPHQLSLGLFIF
jgi:hypothetical protein